MTLCLFRRLSLCVLLIMLAVSNGLAQKSDAPTFDVVSIKPSKPGDMPMFGTGSDLFTSKGQSLWSVVMTAYFPYSFFYWSNSRLVGAPAWMLKENYDIVAKVDGATAKQWSTLSTSQRQERLRPMLQAMLAERCKLVAHTVPVEIPGFALVVAKRGIKFKPTTSNGTTPSGGVALAGGGWLIPHSRDDKPARLTFVNASMASVAELIMGSREHPVQDHTGLTGRYDLEILKREDSSDSDPQASSSFDLGDVGLELKPAKLPSVTVVIDHLERPSTN